MKNKQLEDIESIYMLTLYISLSSSIDELMIMLKDYENHEFHSIIQDVWNKNKIPNIILSSATLPIPVTLTLTQALPL